MLQHREDVKAREDPDLILVIPPITEYADDGFRSMDWADSRFDFHKQLMANVAAAGFADRVVVLDDGGAPGDEEGFYARYVHAKKAIQERLGVKMDLLD